MAPVLSSPGCLNISHHYDMRMRVNLLTHYHSNEGQAGLTRKMSAVIPHSSGHRSPTVVVSDNSFPEGSSNH